MPDQLQLRGGTTTEHNSFTGALREVTVDTTKKTLVVHDGASAGGTPLMRENGGNAASSVQLGSGGVNAFTIDSNQDITLTGASANVVFDKSDNALEFADDAKARFGNSADFNIYHTTTGNSSYILNSTGNLNIGSNNEVRIKGGDDAAEHMGRFIDNGAVELYFDASKKFETTSTGVAVTGQFSVSNTSVFNSGVTFIGDNYNIAWVRSGDMLKFNDEAKLVLGTHADIIIKHDSTNNINFWTNRAGKTFKILHDTENQIVANHNGSIELYHDGSKKFETTSGGVRLSGVLSSNITSGQAISLQDNAQIHLGNGDDLKIYHDGSNSYIDDGSGTGALIYKSNIYSFRNAADSATLATFTENGAVDLYHNGNKKFETTSSGATITGILVSDGLDVGNSNQVRFGDTNNMTIYHDSNNGVISNGTGTLFYLGNTHYFANNSLGEIQARFIENGVAELYYDNSKKLETSAAGVTVTGDISISGEVNLTTGGNKNRFIDSSLSDGEALFLRSTQGGDSNHESLALFLRNGNCQLYFDNSKKLETSSSGVTVTGTVTETSDIALKSDIKPLTNTLEKIQQITGYKYNLLNSISPSMGVLAQDVEKVFPELVHGSEGKKTLQYSGLIGVLVEAVKDLSAKVAALEAA
tara:strand:- start:732 stop:2657 length:1926 start_codon:yes stop_codon:yes gene_type:complete